MVSQLELPLAPAPPAPTQTASSLSRRGPSSVASRPSLSRTRRYNRSHTGAGGGSSSSNPFAAQNEFPLFVTSGDVEIIIRARDTPAVQNRYLLHRHTLTRSSGFFEANTAPEWPRSRNRALAAGNEVSRIGPDGKPVPVEGPGGGTPKRKWRYELDHSGGEDDIPMLIQRDEARDRNGQPLFGPGSTTDLGAGSVPAANSGSYRSSHGRPRAHSRSVSSTPAPSSNSFFRSVANLTLSSSAAAKGQPPPPPLSQPDQDLLRDYDNLFRIFYNYPPVLDGVNVADAYVQCKTLLVLADQYDALAVVGPRVDHHMLQFQSRLWRQIAKYPVSYLRLGYLARSKVIFQEALIHVVGQWPIGERSIRTNLPDAVLDLIEDKVDELEETVSRVEGRLFRLTLTTGRGERVAPHTNYLDWLALSLFRQWLADHTSPQPPPPSDPRRRSGSRDGRSAPLPPPAPPLAAVGRTYRTLGTANPANFLGHEECKRFLKLTPDWYTRENMRRFERRVDELKSMAREIVRPLMSSSLELDMSSSGRAVESVTYLTCTSIGSRDLPWDLDD